MKIKEMSLSNVIAGIVLVLGIFGSAWGASKLVVTTDTLKTYDTQLAQTLHQFQQTIQMDGNEIAYSSIDRDIVNCWNNYKIAPPDKKEEIKSKCEKFEVEKAKINEERVRLRDQISNEWFKK